MKKTCGNCARYEDAICGLYQEHMEDWDICWNWKKQRRAARNGSYFG